MYQSYKMSGNQSRAKTCIRRTELIVNGILFGIWNNLTTIINAKTLVDEGHSWGAALTLFFLFFPGKNKTWFYYHSSICPVIHPSNKSVFYFSTSIWVLGTPNAGWNLLLLLFLPQFFVASKSCKKHTENMVKGDFYQRLEWQAPKGWLK